MKTAGKKRNSKQVQKLLQSSKEEVESRKKAEEFWSDPCWTQPLDQYTSG